METPAPTTTPPTEKPTNTPAANAAKTDAELDALNKRIVDQLARMSSAVEGKSCSQAAAALETALPDYAKAQAEVGALTGPERDRFKQRFVAGGFDDKMDKASTGVFTAAKRCKGDATMGTALQHLGEAETATGGGSQTAP